MKKDANLHLLHGLLNAIRSGDSAKQDPKPRKRAKGGGRNARLQSIEQFLERFPEVTAVIVDGTERPGQRPQDKEQRKAHYSGKKKRFTRKHITGTTRKKRVIVLSKARVGKIHNKRQLDEEKLVENIPDEVAVEGDLGFQGLLKEYVNIHLPHKKPKGKELSEAQKQENQELSRQRVVCEHAHAGMKRYNAVSAIYRTHRKRYTTTA